MVVERALELLAHKVGVAVRICQRQVEKAAGKGAHQDIFRAFDVAIQGALQLRGNFHDDQSRTHSCDTVSAGSFL